MGGRIHQEMLELFRQRLTEEENDHADLCMPCNEAILDAAGYGSSP